MFFSVLIFFSYILFASGSLCENTSYIYKLPGDVTISGIIGAHSGENCSVPEISGLQMVQSLISAIEAIRKNNLVPGLKIGLTIFDSCSREEMAQKAVVSALVDAECSNTFLFGSVMEEITRQQVKNISTNLSLFILPLTKNDWQIMVGSMAAQALYDLHWMPVNKVFSSNENTANKFIEASTNLNICVQEQIQLTDIRKIKPSDTVVVFAKSDSMKHIVENVKGGRLLLVPLDGKYQSMPDIKSSQTLVILPTSLDPVTLNNPFNITESHYYNNVLALTKSSTTLQQLQTVSDMITLTGLIKLHLKKYCQANSEWKLCKNLPKVPPQITTNNQIISSIDSIRSILKFLRIDEGDYEGAAVIKQNAELRRIGSMRLLQKGWILETEINVSDEIKLCKPRPSNDTEGMDCSECSNFNRLYRGFLEGKQDFFTAIYLKEEAWVAALLSISTVGILCCIAIAVFIVVRICKKDMLEGNPGFSFLMLFSIMFMYSAILPFCFQVIDDYQYYNGIFCGLKIVGASLSYSLVFSIMLARSFMLASCDEDGGFMSHINGYLQSVLCFFILAVQIALTLQFWAINWLLLSKEQCISMSSGSIFLYLLGYDMFLLLLLLCISPFTMKSKRNYHEGGYFVFSSFLCLFVWIAWCLGYILLPQWEDVFVCSGMVATATVILVFVFIPRTYLMLTGIVRDHIVSTLPTLAHTASTSVVDVNYRSTQALYDSVTIPRGNTNPNYYAERPTTPSTSKMEDDIRQENAYERYETSPTRNITRF